MAADRRVALDLIINLQKGDMTIEELNEQLKEAKKLLDKMGDDGSDEFKALSQAASDTEKQIEEMNGELKKTKKGFDDTSKAQKEAGKSSNIFSKGLKAIGTGLKAMGIIGLVTGAVKLFYDAISKNQRLMDALSTALGTIGVLFEKLFGVIFNVVDTVSKASNGFSGLTAVMKGLLTIAVTPLKLAFHAIVLTLKQAQLAWEQSFFGGKDPEKVKNLISDIAETQKEIKKTGEEAVKAGGDVVTNMGKAVSEIGGVVGGVVEGVQDISVKGAFEIAKANTELKNSAAIAAAQQGLLVEKFDIQAERQRQIRDEERNSLSERKKANDELGKILDEQEKAMIAQADLQVAAAQQALAANKNTETQTALIEALANKQGVLAQVEGFRSEQKVNDLALDRERMEMDKALSQSEADLAYQRELFDAQQIEDKVKQAEAIRDIELERQEQERVRLQEIVDNANAETQAKVDAQIALDTFMEESREKNIEANAAVAQAALEQSEKVKNKEIEDAKEVQEQREQLAQAAFGALTNIANLLSTGNEKQQKKAFKINKAVSIGQAIQNTAQGVTKAFAQGGVAGIATGALVAAAGAAQIATIAKTKFQGGGQGVESPSNSQVNQALGGGLAGIQPRGFTSPLIDSDIQPTKVIVTETDIRNVSRNVDGVYSRATVVQ
jgi:DNA repair exonuclease SbcCD ATPase subunit